MRCGALFYTGQKTKILFGFVAGVQCATNPALKVAVLCGLR